MTTKLQKLGNSFALIVPKAEVEKMGAVAGDLFELKSDLNKLVYKKVKATPKKYTLKDLLKNFDPKIKHDEIDWGSPVGNEFW